MGKQRLLAIGGEEGGVRIINVDEGLGVHREEKGQWWRAHPNAVFDLKWSGDDTRIVRSPSLWLCSADVQLTASGDQTTRIHSLEGGSPRVTSTMRGHTSSVKTVTFFDPTRSHLDPSIASSIVASAGRDGNILLFDLRCQGRQSAADSPLPLTRPSYSNGVDGFCAQKDTQILEPVMTIRGAHGEGSRKTTPNHHVGSAGFCRI
jgi:denticleless